MSLLCLLAISDFLTSPGWRHRRRPIRRHFRRSISSDLTDTLTSNISHNLYTITHGTSRSCRRTRADIDRPSGDTQQTDPRRRLMARTLRADELWALKDKIECKKFHGKHLYHPRMDMNFNNVVMTYPTYFSNQWHSDNRVVSGVTDPTPIRCWSSEWLRQDYFQYESSGEINRTHSLL